MSVNHVKELLIEKIKKDYKDDIALVVMMGSQIFNDTHKKSDLDLYFVPKTKRGYNLGFVFTLDGIGFDIWPISWERLENIAKWNERIVSIITDGQILFVSSDEDLDRFNQLKASILDQSIHPSLKEKAKTKFKEAYKIYFDLCTSDHLSDVRKHGIKLLYLVTEVISMYNQIPVKRGRKHLKSEIMNMPDLPKGFSELYEGLFQSKDIKYIKCQLQELIKRMEMWFSDKSKHIIIPFKDQAHGFYEEIINNYNKIERAVELSDPYTALFAAAEIEFEFEWLFKDTDVKKDLPDLLSYYHPNQLEEFGRQASIHHQAVLKLLSDHDVRILTFHSDEELGSYLDQL
jgi:hypothetical protein